MEGLKSLALILLAGLSPTLSFAASTLFADGFEAGPLGPAWSVTKTFDGRAVVSSDGGAATGTSDLVLDDATNDAVYSVAEATLTLDLPNKKNVVLNFKAKSLGNEANVAPTGTFTTQRNYDGVAISVDGGTTWRAVQSLDSVPTVWTSYSVTLDSSVASLGGTFWNGFRIRFSEYDNGSAPIDGIAIDDVLVTADDDQRSVLELPASVLEGTGPYTGYVLLAYAPPAPLTLTLVASPSGQLTLPATVTVPAGQAYASFDFGVANDLLINLTRNISVTASAPGVTAASANISITDDDVPVATLFLPPQLAEGATPTNNATLALDRTASVALTVTLTTSPTAELSLPATVTVPAGQSSVSFTARAVDDTKIDGNVLVTVTASSGSLFTTTATTTTIDNELRTLALTLPATLQEGGTGTGTVTISGTLTSALDVTLAGSDSASLTVPTTVTIAAGSTSASFTIAAVENAVRDGSRTVAVTASAGTFTSATKSTVVRDNDIATYAVSALTDIVNLSSPVSVTIKALDVEGNLISGVAGTVNLSLVLPDGSTRAVSPATATLSGSSWTGSVTFPSVAAAPLRLRVSDAGGVSSDSIAFDALRALALPAGDLAWDAARGRIYASVPAAAASTYANKVVAIDPATLQITGSVTTNQDPGQLALTSGGEALYVALNANGSIAKIDLATFTVTLTYPVGTDSYYGTLYAHDICTVAGQPNTLLVSQANRVSSSAFVGVAAYDNGVRRTNRSPSYPAGDFIEPSASASVFFSYNAEDTGYDFARLQLDASGVSLLSSSGALLSGFSTDMRSDGDRVYATSGTVVDGGQMRQVGTFGVTGLVRPDATTNRVFFLEQPASYSSTYDKISAWDPATFSLIRRLSLPAAVTSPASFIRAGGSQLAFRTSSTLYVVTSAQLVPSDPPANLAVTMQGTPNPATIASPLTWTARVTNQGPNVAHGTAVSIVLSDSQTLTSTSVSSGTTTASGLVTTWTVGDLAVGASATCTLTALPQSAGILTCSGSASSNAIDSDYSDNAAYKAIGVGFTQVVDVVAPLRLTANNLLTDSTRNVLWATIPSTVAAPVGKSLISIDPKTGLASVPIALAGNPYNGSLALSANGRFLYVGLSDLPEVQRLDLSTSPPTSLRIPLGASQWGELNYAEDLEVLDGDGTSFLMVGTNDHSAAAYDGTVRRTNRSGIYTVDRIERTATANTFVGFDNSDSSYAATRLAVTASGVSISQTVSGLLSGGEIAGSGSLLLSSSGVLINSGGLTLISNLGLSGRPCLESVYQRAYLVNGAAIKAYDTGTGTLTASLTLPTASTGDWAQKCVRWGLDGLAVLGSDKLYLARWSSVIPTGFDLNHNNLADSWEATYFGALGVNPSQDLDGDGLGNGLEYLFATRPDFSTACPVQYRSVPSTLQSGGTTLHIVFPRRSGVAQPLYRYEFSPDMLSWNLQPVVVETILSTQTIGGVTVETVDATIECPPNSSGFARLRWVGT